MGEEPRGHFLSTMSAMHVEKFGHGPNGHCILRSPSNEYVSIFFWALCEA